MAAVHAQDPAQLVVQHLLEARRQGQALEGVPRVWPQLAQAVAAQVLQGRGAGAGADDLHAALGSRGADHRVEPSVLKPSSSHAYALPVLEKGQCPMPGVQVYTNNGALTKA